MTDYIFTPEIGRGIIFIAFAFYALGLMTYGAIRQHRNPDRPLNVGATIAVTVAFLSAVMTIAMLVSR
jgi:hypothetical protein